MASFNRRWFHRAVAAVEGVCGLAAATLLTTALPCAAAAPAPPSTQVAWLPAGNDADIERAFARARAEAKPVFLYWGAKWCPPCNQLKATLFNRQDFAQRSNGFVPVHIDGDMPGAQKLGARFKVTGYPTMILFAADGSELTRLPGEVEPAQVMALLQQGMAGGRPVAAVLADARAGTPLAANEWRLLAFHSWETDGQQLVPQGERAALLASLAGACSEPESATRLWLKALAGSDDWKGVAPEPGSHGRLVRLLADPAASRAQMDVLVNAAPNLLRVLASDGAAAQPDLAAAFDIALQRFEADVSLSRGDRLGALLARVELARARGLAGDAGAPAVAPELLAEARVQAARADRETADAYERQAVIPLAAYLLGRAGRWADSDALLKANLANSPNPYYLMSQLASNAKAQRDPAGALAWYRQAFERSEGPATRLQWGASYLGALVDLAPADAARIERTAAALIAEAAREPAAFHQRSERAWQRIGQRLLAWNQGAAHGATLRRLQARLEHACGGIDAADSQRAACLKLLAGAANEAPE